VGAGWHQRSADMPAKHKAMSYERIAQCEEAVKGEMRALAAQVQEIHRRARKDGKYGKDKRGG